jgi:putative addiction module component (TIGR02574 family)
VTERLALAELIWDSIVDDGGPIEFSDAQKAELDRRLELRNLERGSSWGDVKRRIQGHASYTRL